MNESLPDTAAWRIIERMLLIRRFEEAVLRLAAAKEFAGHYHLYIGQEATGAAAVDRLTELDADVTGRIAAAVEFALASPMPAPETALQHVYA